MNDCSLHCCVADEVYDVPTYAQLRKCTARVAGRRDKTKQIIASWLMFFNWLTLSKQQSEALGISVFYILKHNFSSSTQFVDIFK